MNLLAVKVLLLSLQSKGLFGKTLHLHAFKGIAEIQELANQMEALYIADIK